MCIICAVLVGGGFILLKGGFQAASRVAAVLFALCLVGTLSYMWYRLFHIHCPTCGRQARTIKDSSRTCWIAHCEDCGIGWKLGVDVE
jgi:hypothetical protein